MSSKTTPCADSRRPCLCCGHLVHNARDWPGSYSICRLCGWEDDATQFLDPFSPIGANQISLYDAQQNYQAFGASEERFRNEMRPPHDAEPVDAAWRPINLDTDKFAPDPPPPSDYWEKITSWADVPANFDWRKRCWWLPEFESIYGANVGDTKPVRLATDAE